MGNDLKPIRWLGTTLEDIRAQRLAVRSELGQQLLRVQLGLMPNNYKPMTTVGAGAYEMRVQDPAGITSKADIDLAKKRYREARDG